MTCKARKKINRPSQSCEAPPYLQGLTEEIKENICKTQCLGPRYTICNASIDSIRPKDPLDPSEKYGVVYEVACKQCDQAYVAETKRSLRKRVEQGRSKVFFLTGVGGGGALLRVQALSRVPRTGSL